MLVLYFIHGHVLYITNFITGLERALLIKPDFIRSWEKAQKKPQRQGRKEPPSSNQILGVSGGGADGDNAPNRTVDPVDAIAGPSSRSRGTAVSAFEQLSAAALAAIRPGLPEVYAVKLISFL